MAPTTGGGMKRKYNYELIKAKLRKGLTCGQIKRIFGCSHAVILACKSEMIGEQNKRNKSGS